MIVISWLTFTPDSDILRTMEAKRSTVPGQRMRFLTGNLPPNHGLSGRVQGRFHMMAILDAQGAWMR